LPSRSSDDNVGRQAHSVAHRQHQLALDDRERLELFLGLDPLLALGGGEAFPRLGAQQRGGGEDEGGGREQQLAGRLHGGAPLVRSCPILHQDRELPCLSCPPGLA
jgi:hypothetical protein